MSFAREAKLQVLKQPLENDCCGIAFLSGLLRVSGEWDIQTHTVSIITDIKEVFDFCNAITKQLYGDSSKLEIENDFKINKTIYYRITLPKSNSFEFLRDCGIMINGEYNFEKIDRNIIQSPCCKKAFIKGVFVGCATSGIKLSVKTEKTSTGYDIDFVSHSQLFLEEFAKVLKEFNITPKIVQRRKQFVLYIKESSQVCDLLALVEAFNSVIKLQDELALRELRNKVNRQTNCMNANISKTIEASLRQVSAIQKISDSVGLEVLPIDLQEVALLRLANPEESLGELLTLSNLPITKSGLNHKLNKIIKISKDLTSN